MIGCLVGVGDGVGKGDALGGTFSEQEELTKNKYNGPNRFLVIVD